MSTVIPLSAVPAQKSTVSINNQSCTIQVYVLSDRLYFDLSVDDVDIVTGVLCLDRVRLVNKDYLGFVGDLAFVDTAGTSDPSYDGLGSRFVLVYLP